ncbi:MAG: serine hydrolase domain-containing protein [Alphaproteobacteria bacterium]
MIAVGHRDEAPAIAAAGLANLASHAAMRPESGFKIASIGKSFLSALTLMLVDEGKLGLDDKLSRFVPDVANAGRVSLRQLLNHTAGYDDYITDTFIAAAHAQPGKRWTPRELLAFAHPETLNFSPGSRFDYSNTNYLLVGMALEAALGHAPSTEIRRRFLIPLGLTQTWFAAEDEIPAGYLARGYGDLDDSSTLADATGEPAELGGADGAMLSSAADLVRWSAALLGGRVLSKARLGDMLSFVGIDDEDSAPGSGYGLGIERARYAGVMLYGHTGSAPGYDVAMLYEPVTETTIVVALNEDPPDETLIDIIAERVVRAIDDTAKVRFPKAPEIKTPDVETPPAP